MIDFDALVVRPAMSVFGEPFTIYPDRSSSASYTVRGSWSERPVDVILQDEGLASSQVKTLAIRRSEYPENFGQGWIVVRKKTNARYIVDDLDDDGQGGSLVTLKALSI